MLKKIGISVIEKNNTKKKLECLVIEKNNTKKNWNVCLRKK